MITGGCFCKKIRYEVAGEPAATVHCHCRHCQYSSGAGHSTIAVVKKEEFRLLSGEPREYEFKGESGFAVGRQFCGDCGTPLFSRLEQFPKMWGVKAASLDDPGALKPVANLWLSRAHGWDALADLPKFDKGRT
jgi:hypothetical protein